MEPRQPPAHRRGRLRAPRPGRCGDRRPRLGNLALTQLPSRSAKQVTRGADRWQGPARPLAGARRSDARVMDAAEFLLAAGTGLAPALGGAFDAADFRRADDD